MNETLKLFQTEKTHKYLKLTLNENEDNILQRN